MTLFRVDLTVTVETAMSIGGAGTVGTLADKSLLRDGWNRPFLPASQIKGRLRHACEAIARGLEIPVCEGPNPASTCPHYVDSEIPVADDGRRLCLICELFGSPAHPGALRFRDLLPGSGSSTLDRLYVEQEALRPGVGLDRRRGVVQENLLFLTETTPAGVLLAFRRPKAIQGHLGNAAHAILILMALESVLNWGGGKSRGMGWARVDYEAQFGARVLTLADEQGQEELRKLCHPH